MDTEQIITFKPGQRVTKEVIRFSPGNPFTGSPDREFKVVLVGHVTASGKWIALTKNSVWHAFNRKRVPVTEEGWK